MKIVIIAFLLAILVILWMRRGTIVKKCPAGYYYAPWASSGSACIPIGISSSEAGVSTDATRPEVYCTLMSPA